MYAAYGRIGQQRRVPITGNRAKCLLHGAIKVHRGDLALWITEVWDQGAHLRFLSVVRSRWRCWHIVLFEDRAPQHKAPPSLAEAERPGIEVRPLPRAMPELNAMDDLWRQANRAMHGNRPPQLGASDLQPPSPTPYKPSPG